MFPLKPNFIWFGVGHKKEICSLLATSTASSQILPRPAFLRNKFKQKWRRNLAKSIINNFLFLFFCNLHTPVFLRRRSKYNPLNKHTITIMSCHDKETNSSIYHVSGYWLMCIDRMSELVFFLFVDIFG